MKNLYQYQFLENKITTKENTNIVHNNKNVSHSNSTKKKTYEFCKIFCKNTSAKLAFSPFKLQDLFSSKDCLPVALSPYLCRMSTMLRWGNQTPFTNEDQGTSTN